MSSTLALSDDDIALLRFTCDLFFVEESPLWAFESSAREPDDYDASYRALVERGVIDPHGFRMTDGALNRVAPVTECDARVVHLEVDGDGGVFQEDHWMLDEIAVTYERVETPQGVRHVFGPDLDAEALIARVGRRLVPRRAGGDRFDATLTPFEVMAVSLLLEAKSTATTTSAISEDEFRMALAKIPPDEAPLLAPALPAKTLLALTKPREPRTADDVLRSLLEKRVLVREGRSLRLTGALQDLRTPSHRRRHTIVRTDFRDEHWLVREVTLFPAAGSLFVVAPARGGFRLADLDGDSLREVVAAAVAPQGPGARAQEQPRFASLLAGARR
jgi:hypothetical protein